MIFKFTVPGKPQTKARPRFTRRGGVYTKKETVDYEKTVRTCFSAATTKQNYLIKKDGPILVCIDACFPIPISWTKGKQLAAKNGTLQHTSKPDFDNVAKIIIDALNGLAWKDDSQIVSATVRKHFSENPRVEVIIRGEINE